MSPSEPTGLCKRCGMPAPHLWPSGCIDALRERIATLEVMEITHRLQLMKAERARGRETQAPEIHMAAASGSNYVANP